MTILERMDRALLDLAERWGGRRAPKAFYLGPADWDEFEKLADLACTVTLPFGNNPPQMRTDPAFKDVPVRQSKAVGEHSSRLYDHASYGHPLWRKDDPAAPPRTTSPPPLLADQLVEKLDAISRTRALTEPESVALEHALKGRVVISQREAIRLGLRP